MSALLLAMYADYETASRVRVELIQDGFPTDRVDLTASCDPGRACLEPATSLHDKFVQYFGALFARATEQHRAELLAERIDKGAIVIIVHPRGIIETERATEILNRAPVEIMPHDLENQTMEWAASRDETPWIRNLMAENHSNAHCIYCRLFERDLEED
jgi:hypothetical protein